MKELFSHQWTRHTTVRRKDGVLEHIIVPIKLRYSHAEEPKCQQVDLNDTDNLPHMLTSTITKSTLPVLLGIL